jgi:endonuclease/exonuclease/phosphatase (EEP) superfamily protein YafD
MHTLQGKAAGTLRVLSANLYGGRARPTAVAALVEALQVDVLAAQELSFEQADALREVLPYGDLDPHAAHEGMGVALRRPARTSRVPISFRNARVAHLSPADWPELAVPLDVINVHIAAPHLAPPLGGLMRRRRQLRSLEAYLAELAGRGDTPQPAATPPASEPEAAAPAPSRVLVGDFNATPLWPVYRRIASQLTDAAIAVAQQRGRPLKRTWGPWYGAPRLLRIDHGFVLGVHVEEFEVVEVPGSDHSAIVMDLRSGLNGVERAERVSAARWVPAATAASAAADSLPPARPAAAARGSDL